jgi:hypothetical protein
MTITLRPSTEALLREKARQEGQDLDTLADTILADSLEAQKREVEEITAAVRGAIAAVESGREKPLTQYLAEQRAKRGLPDTWPSARLIESETGVAVAE